VELLEQQQEREHEQELAPVAEERPEEPESARWGSREVEIQGVRLLNLEGESHLVFHPDDAVEVEIRYLVREPTEDVVFGIGLTRNDGLNVFGTNTQIGRVSVPPLGTTGTATFRVERLNLLDGQYLLDVAVHREDGYPYDYHKGAVVFSVRSPERHVGVMCPAHRWMFRKER
jgi:lipopolysaccharide transport system ATP-binding protein